MTNVSENYLQLKKKITQVATNCNRNPEEITIVAVTKNHSLKHVLPAYEVGCHHFGENKVQEALTKIPEAPQDLNWHFIGTLQKNKVKKVIGKFSLIHSVDSLELAKKIDSYGVMTNILLEVNTSNEKSKHGLSEEEWTEKIDQILKLKSINFQGLMTMAPFTTDETVIRSCFQNLRKFKEEVEKRKGIELPHLSMGMTNDYPIAIQEGATLLRIGTAIFGER